MVNLSGYYKAPDGRVIVKDDEGVLHLASDPNEKHSFRPDKQFFLCEDDGLVGKYGNPKAVRTSQRDYIDILTFTGQSCH